MMTSVDIFETEFNNAIDYFFGHNPRNPHWILVALFLRHEHKLHIVENYSGEKSCIIAPEFDYDYACVTALRKDLLNRWNSGELSNICVIGDIEGNIELQRIIQEFEHQANLNANNADFKLMSFRQWEPGFLIETAQKLLYIDDDWFDSNFTKLFDICIARLFSKQNVGMFVQPKEVSELGAALLGKVNGTVFNPYAGIGSYGLNIKGNFEYLGEEIMPLAAAIGNIRLMANHVNGKIKIADSVKSLDKSINIEAVITTPPFGMRLDESHSNFLTHESFLLHQLSEGNCKSVVVCRAGICFNGGSDKRIRQELMNKQLIDMVILLPANIFSMTAISTVVFVLNKNHNHHGMIRFIDASKCFKGDNRNPILDVEAIIQLTQDSSDKSNLVSYKEIINNDFSMNPAQYMPVALPNRNGEIVKLCEIGTIESQRENSTDSKGLFASFSKLTNANHAKIFTNEDFDETEIPRHALKITKPCLLISGIRGLRSVCINPMGQTLYGNNSYMCFLYDATRVNPQYLALQLREEYVQAQIGASSTLSVSREAFCNIQIILPSLEEQGRFVATYQNDLIGKLGIEMENSRSREFEEFERNMRIRRHSLGNKLQSIMPAAQLIRDFVARQERPFSKNDIVGKRSGTTLIGMIERLYANLQRVEDLVDKFTEVEEFGEPEIIDLSHFCADYAYSAIKGDYELAFVGNSVITNNLDGYDKESPDLLIRFSQRDLEFVFENIISNAKRHGFTDAQRKDYVVRIEFGNFIDADGMEKVYIRFFNNGNKLPSGMNPQKVFDWGVGNGSGLGGWHLKRIVEHFGGSITFQEIENSIDGYSVEYEIIVPLINTEE